MIALLLEHRTLGDNGLLGEAGGETARFGGLSLPLPFSVIEASFCLYINPGGLTGLLLKAGGLCGRSCCLRMVGLVGLSRGPRALS